MNGEVKASGISVNAASAALGSTAVLGMPPVEKVVVAIHGVGDQLRSSTIRYVARRFGDREKPPLPVMPLGFFSVGVGDKVQISRLDVAPNHALAKIGFAEVFWADIPRGMVKAGDTLEETKAWASTIVSRVRAAYMKQFADAQDRRMSDVDFELCAGVVEELVEAVAVLESLLFVFAKMGIFKFDLAPLLRDYVDDVQVVAEFGHYRDQIVGRFSDAMTQILEVFKTPAKLPEIHVVAHSEGTVVSFLGLLRAMSADTGADWIGQVRGLMTIGSPIDKHLVLWPNIWDGIQVKSRLDQGAVVFERSDGTDRGLRLNAPIQWRNYYDYGDPIGFELDEARQFLTKRRCTAFDFGKTDDIGFSRYILPGKAHNDYWNDADVFGHFIEDVVIPPAKGAASPVAPSSKRGVALISTALPYALAIVLHVAGVYLLFKSIVSYLDPKSAQAPSVVVTAASVTLLGILLFCSTAAARLPRLVKRDDPRWYVLAAALFAVGASATWWLLPPGPATFLGDATVAFTGATGKTGLLVAAGLAALSGWVAPRRPRWGRRVLLMFGGAIVLAMIAPHFIASNDHGKVWPVVLAGAAFVYLWWLGMMVFDLAFIWHRYIRYSIAVKLVTGWCNGDDACPPLLLRRERGFRARSTRFPSA